MAEVGRERGRKGREGKEDWRERCVTVRAMGAIFSRGAPPPFGGETCTEPTLVLQVGPRGWIRPYRSSERCELTQEESR